MSDLDLSRFLADWPLQPGQINARVIEAEDGSSKIQVRVDLGVLQMEPDGRPDGQRPDGSESLLELHRRRAAAAAGAGDGPYVLDEEDCRAIRQEAVQMHHRYAALFSLGDYARVVRDTEHSLGLFDLCRDHGSTDVDRTLLEQFRPQVVTMRVRAQAELAVQRRDTDAAVRALQDGLRDLRAVFEEVGSPESFEESSEAMLLRGMRDALVPRLPSSQRAELQERLQAALDAENYELAAILRDELRMLK